MSALSRCECGDDCPTLELPVTLETVAGLLDESGVTRELVASESLAHLRIAECKAKAEGYA